MKHLILKRKRINEQLNNIFDYRLTLVIAAMGYGKTTAVKDFLDEAKVKYFWLSVESDENSAQHIWNGLTRQLAKHEPEFGNQLNALGFPVDSPQRDRVINIISDYACTAKTVLVIDDYHFANSPELDRLLERIVWADINGLHLILISRTKPEMRMEELKLKQYCYQVNSELFELSINEIKAYFRLFGQEISDDISRQVHQITEGWITAVYLISQRYCEIGSLEPGRSIESLIEAAIFSHYKPEEIRLLLSLSIFDSFSPQQAVYITEDATAIKIMQRLSNDNSLIRYDERTDIYKIHHILKGYLRKVSAERLNDLEFQKLYKRMGEWHIQNGDVLLGLKSFLKAGEYDLILIEFEKAGITKVIDRDPPTIVALFEQIPIEVKYRHPIGYLTYADFYLTDVDWEGGAGLLTEIEEYYRDNGAVLPGLKRRIDGEIELCRSFLQFNDIHKMQACQLNAHKMLDGRSAIANKEMLFSYCSPHFLYVYHKEKGGLHGLMECAGSVFNCYRELSGGCGAGVEHLARAEYLLETSDVTKVESYAYKTVYKAETMEQVLIIICADLTLARAYAAQGRFAEAMEIIDTLAAQTTGYDNPIFNSIVDMCAGYLGGILNEPGSFAHWLSSGDLNQCKLLYPGMAFSYIIHAKAILLAQNYAKLEALCEEMCRLFDTFNNLFGYLHAHILDAAAKYRLYGLEEAKAAMEPALNIGRADGIVMPFAEYGIYILDILKELQAESGDDDYLDRLIRETSRYSANLKLFKDQKTAAGELTEREREILRLMVQGQTNREIAAGLYIAEITVRKNITSIYRKLEVDGRAMAVKKAVETKLV